MAELLGVAVHQAGVEDIHVLIGETILRKEKAVILHLNIHGVNYAIQMPWLKNFFNRAKLVFCDGDGVRLGLWILGQKVPPKVTYDRWIWQLAEFCAAKGYRLFLLGAKPGIAALAANKLRQRYPALPVAGAQDGYFAKSGSENEKVIAEINSACADILIVGLGMPLQEEWLCQNVEKLNCRVFLTAGAVFDYASGNFKRAPVWMIQWHLEWLFRFSQDPRRLFGRYFLGIPYFFYHVFLACLNTKKTNS